MWCFQVTTMFHLDRPMYLLGYLANQSRVYLVDKEFKWVASGLLVVIYCEHQLQWASLNKIFGVVLFPVSVIGYTLLLSLIEYKTLVMRGDLEQASQILPSIPKEHLNRYFLHLAIHTCDAWWPEQASQIAPLLYSGFMSMFRFDDVQCRSSRVKHCLRIWCYLRLNHIGNA